MQLDSSQAPRIASETTDAAMPDFDEGIKREVAEIKFLIHDLRVEKFINDVIHYQVTLNTDLEIHNIEQVAVMHSHDLLELKRKAQELRRAYRAYSNAVKSFSPPQTILAMGESYVGTIQDVCELIINPLWGRFDSVISFLPRDCRSVQSARRYKNCLHWICGVFYRIEHFLEEKGGGEVDREFDVAADMEDFTTNVIKGYVTEKSSSRVDIIFDALDSGVVWGNKYRFRRMLFNLVMNSVDAMTEQRVGTLHVGVANRGDRLHLTVHDDGCGMTKEKCQSLLFDRATLDGDMHSLGFIFVRQTVDAFGGELEIDSTPGEGTLVTVRMPLIPGKVLPPKRRSKCEKFRIAIDHDPDSPIGAVEPLERRAALTQRVEPPPSAPPPAASPQTSQPSKPLEEEAQGVAYGEILLDDYAISRSDFKGCIFAISADDAGQVDMFIHRPYEAHWDISHEDLSPMLYEATVRGRIEEDELRQPGLILKAPLSLRDYLELKEVDAREFSPQKYNQMVRDEYIAVCRVLVRTGLDPEMVLQATDLKQLFPDYDTCFGGEPFPLRVMAEQKLTSE